MGNRRGARLTVLYRWRFHACRDLPYNLPGRSPPEPGKSRPLFWGLPYKKPGFFKIKKSWAKTARDRPLLHKLPHILENYDKIFFAIARFWDNIQLKAAEVFCIVKGRSILLPGQCILQIFWLGTIICKDKELNTRQFITEEHSFAKIQDQLFFTINSHFCRKKREQSYQPGCSDASTS